MEPLRPIYDAWMTLIAAFAWLLSRVTLTALFFTAFSVYGILIRLTGRDPMRRRIDPDRDSYWRDNVVNNADLDDFRTQY